jgi:hypothetical protein
VAGSPAHSHTLGFQHVVQTVSLPPGESVQRVTCPDGYKGIVGTYDLPPGVVSLGNEPQPINRDFRLLNTTSGNLDVVLDLECLAIETGSPHDQVLTVTNTATAGTSTYEPDLSDNSDSASMLLTVSPGTVLPAVQHITVASSGKRAKVTAKCTTAGGCAGTMRLTAKVRSGGHTRRVVIGSTHFRITRGRTVVVPIPIAQKYRPLIRAGRVAAYRVQ